MTDTNTAVGVNALGALPTGADNTAVGANALKSATSSTPIQNVAVGSGAGNGITSGSGNVVIGYDSASSLTTGSNNIVIGASASVPSASTSGYLNIGGAISGSTLSSGTITLNPLVNFKAKTQLSTDNSTNLATTAFVTTAVGAATGAMFKLTTGSVDTSSMTLCKIDLSSYTTYTSLELRISKIVTTGSGTDLTIEFSSGGTANAGTNYGGLTSGQINLTGPMNDSPPIILPYNSGANFTDGSGTLVLQGFCNSNTSVIPIIFYDIIAQNTGSNAGNSYFSVGTGKITCNQVTPQTYDGLKFVGTGGVVTFDWALYGIS